MAEPAPNFNALSCGANSLSLPALEILARLSDARTVVMREELGRRHGQLIDRIRNGDESARRELERMHRANLQHVLDEVQPLLFAGEAPAIELVTPAIRVRNAAQDFVDTYRYVDLPTRCDE